MLRGVYIFVDDDFSDPVYAEPSLDELEHELRIRLCEIIDDAIEGERPASAIVSHGEVLIGYRFASRTGITHAAIVEDGVAKGDLTEYLQELASTYADEVDAPRQPERAGVADVVDVVERPWEE